MKLQYLILTFICTLFLLLQPQKAFAQQSYDAITPSVVARIIQEAGLSYQSKFDESGRPRIVVTDSNLPSEQFEIYFFDCVGDVKCESITLWSWYIPTVGINYARCNRWNQRNRFTRAYLDGDFNPVLEMDIQGLGGLGRQNLVILINAYIAAIPVYAEYMKVDMSSFEPR